MKGCTSHNYLRLFCGWELQKKSKPPKYNPPGANSSGEYNPRRGVMFGGFIYWLFGLAEVYGGLFRCNCQNTRRAPMPPPLEWGTAGWRPSKAPFTVTHHQLDRSPELDVAKRQLSESPRGFFFPFPPQIYPWKWMMHGYEWIMWSLGIPLLYFFCSPFQCLAREYSNIWMSWIWKS